MYHMISKSLQLLLTSNYLALLGVFIHCRQLFSTKKVFTHVVCPEYGTWNFFSIADCSHIHLQNKEDARAPPQVLLSAM